MLDFEIRGRLSDLGFEYEEQEVEQHYGATRMKLVASGRGHQFVEFWWKGNESIDQYHLELICQAQRVVLDEVRNYCTGGAYAGWKDDILTIVGRR